MKQPTASQKILRVVNWLKYGVLGAIGGIAIVNTVAMIAHRAPGESVEQIAMGIGAIAAAAIAKAVHLL